VQSVASGSTSALNFLELLGLVGTIKVLDMTYVTSPCLMRLAECGAIRHVHTHDLGDYSGPSDAWLAATSTAGLVLTDSYGTGATGGGADVVFDASFDPGFLNRGEWIKFMALFFNAEAAANAYFDSAVASVAAAQAAALAAAAALNGGPRPVVAFASYDEWSGEWQLSNASYKMQYVAAANGMLAPMPAAGVNGVTYKTWTNPPTTAAFSDAASARAALAGVSVLIDETPVWPGSPETYTLRTFLSNWGFTAADSASTTYPFLKNGRIFREDKTINDGGWGSFGTDWFANSVSQPQVALADFLSVLYPGTAAAAAAGGTVWLRNLAANEPFVVRESSQCVGSAATAVTAICGGPSTTLTLRNLRPAAFTPAALEAAIMAALPSGTTASVTSRTSQSPPRCAFRGRAACWTPREGPPASWAPWAACCATRWRRPPLRLPAGACWRPRFRSRSRLTASAWTAVPPAPPCLPRWPTARRCWLRRRRQALSLPRQHRLRTRLFLRRFLSRFAAETPQPRWRR